MMMILLRHIITKTTNSKNEAGREHNKISEKIYFVQLNMLYIRFKTLLELIYSFT
jgi:hypothetical protein